MEKHLDFYCFLGSTYTYLAVNRAEEVAARENITLRWRPFSVRSIMLEQNNRPFIGKPVKLSYMWRDIERRAHRYGVPFKSIPNYPNDAEELANRVATLAALEGGAHSSPRLPMQRGSWRTKTRARSNVYRTSYEG